LQGKIKRLQGMDEKAMVVQALDDYFDQCYDEFKALNNETDAYLEEV
jgi:hypothetical protein